MKKKKSSKQLDKEIAEIVAHPDPAITGIEIKEGETTDDFIDRAIRTARKAKYPSVDFGGGPMCFGCAPSTAYADDGVATFYTTPCYNCEDNTD